MVEDMQCFVLLPFKVRYSVYVSYVLFFPLFSEFTLVLTLLTSPIFLLGGMSGKKALKRML